MPALPVLKPKQVLKALRRAGFFVDRQRGSHVSLRREGYGGTVTVPMHNKDLKPKTLRSIINQAGLDLEEFLKLL
ncbi:MAG: type II toxin-antitoxin system HicA family toxin [Deltaproteobacteria bacterium]|nr:type II toxin-antitoxin system HicA family toxin [Deltaproteobacteria bacterium]